MEGVLTSNSSIYALVAHNLFISFLIANTMNTVITLEEQSFCKTIVELLQLYQQKLTLIVEGAPETLLQGIFRREKELSIQVESLKRDIPPDRIEKMIDKLWQKHVSLQ